MPLKSLFLRTAVLALAWPVAAQGQYSPRSPYRQYEQSNTLNSTAAIPRLPSSYGYGYGGAANSGQSASQGSAADRTKNFNRAPKFVPPNSQRRGPLSTFDSSRYNGAVTIPDQIRSIVPNRRRPTRFDPPVYATSPIKSLLNSHNVLGARSALGQKTVWGVNNNDYSIDDASREKRNIASTQAAEPIDIAKINPLKPDDGSYQNNIEKRLSLRADDYYEQGAAAFRKGKFIQARNYFQLVNDIEPSKTRSYLANVIVSVQKNDFSQALGSFLRALDIMTSLDDLKLDPTKFYKGDEDFKRHTEQLNLIAQSNSSNPAPNLILAYYSMLNGDIGTAINAASAAEKVSPGVSAVPVKKFREMLIQRRSAPKASP